MVDRRIQRFGFRLGRGWILLLLFVGAVLLVVSWIGPLRPMPARLELVALSGGTPAEQVATSPLRTRTGSVVFPVEVAVRNTGSQTARPRRVALSVPAHLRLATTRGRLSGEVTPGLPMRRHVVELGAPVLAPDSSLHRLPGIDTIYIEPDLPRYYCTTQGLQIPEFTPAPRFNPQTLSDVRIFYSFAGTGGAERHTGVLTVALDPAALDVRPAAPPPTFPTIVEEPEARAPDVGPLSFAGVRRAYCGDPQQPVDIYTVLWETLTGGRVFVLYVDNIGRKRLYDLNRDGIIELETWDGDGDGRFEARRAARFPVPDFLIPLPPRDPEMVRPDPERPDSAWLAMFHDAGRGPFRFAQSQLAPHPQPVIAAIDSAGAPRTVDRSDPAADLGPVPPADERFLALFADTAAGPFRFSDRPRVSTPVQPQAARDTATPVRVQPATEQVAPAESPPVEPEPEPEPPPRRPRPRKPPLGTPIRH